MCRMAISSLDQFAKFLTLFVADGATIIYPSEDWEKLVTKWEVQPDDESFKKLEEITGCKVTFDEATKETRFAPR